MTGFQRLAGLIAGALALVSAGCVSAPSTDPAELGSGEWTLDPGHTSVIWRVRHMGLSWYTARFDTAEATLDFDPARPEEASLTAVVQTASVSTGDADFDETLRGKSWFDAGAHPELVFRSTRIEKISAASGRVHGELTIKGETREVILETEFYGGVFNPLEGREAIGFRAETEIDRTEFDVGRLPGNLIGDTVRIEIEAEFLKSE